MNDENTANPVPGWLRKSLLVTFALSSVVFIEPAPTDICLIFLTGLCFLLGYLQYDKAAVAGLVCLWLFILANLVSMYMVQDVSYGFKYLLTTVYLIVFWLFLVGMLSFFKGRVLPVIFQGYIVAAIISLVVGLIAFSDTTPLTELFFKADRIKGLFKDPNVYGPFLIPVSLYAIYRVISQPKAAAKVIWSALFIVTSVFVFLSYSRAAWINFVVCALTMIWFGLRKANRLNLKTGLLLLVILAVCGLCIFGVLQYTAAGELFDIRFKMQQYDEERFGTHSTALKQFFKYPLGIGPGQAVEYYELDTHSLYIRTLSENGFIGFLVFMAFMALTFVRSFRLCFKEFEYQGYLIITTIALAGIFVNSLVIDTLHWRHFWLFLAIPWGFPDN